MASRSVRIGLGPCIDQNLVSDRRILIDGNEVFLIRNAHGFNYWFSEQFPNCGHPFGRLATVELDQIRSKSAQNRLQDLIIRIDGKRDGLYPVGEFFSDPGHITEGHASRRCRMEDKPGIGCTGARNCIDLRTRSETANFDAYQKTSAVQDGKNVVFGAIGFSAKLCNFTVQARRFTLLFIRPTAMLVFPEIL